MTSALQLEVSLSRILVMLEQVDPRLDASKFLGMWKTIRTVASSLPPKKCQPVTLLDEKSSSQQVCQECFFVLTLLPAT